MVTPVCKHSIYVQLFIAKNSKFKYDVGTCHRLGNEMIVYNICSSVFQLSA